MRKLLLTGAFNYNTKHFNELEKLGYEIIFVQDETKPLTIDPSEIVAVVCNALFLYNDIEKFTKLKTIQLTSAGFDRVPMDYIKNNNIQINNADNVYSIPIAEWTVLKVLEIYKKSRIFYKNQEKKLWQKERELVELTDKKAAIIGYGNVGKQIAKRLSAFDVKITAVSRSKKSDEFIDRFEYIEELETVLKSHDIIILSLPLNKKTKYLINKEKLEIMKDDSVLINISRGEIINENDLITTLGTNKILGVALDVFEQEPLDQNSKLWKFKNVLITPHNSFISNENQERLWRKIYHNIS